MLIIESWASPWPCNKEHHNKQLVVISKASLLSLMRMCFCRSTNELMEFLVGQNSRIFNKHYITLCNKPLKCITLVNAPVQLFNRFNATPKLLIQVILYADSSYSVTHFTVLCSANITCCVHNTWDHLNYLIITYLN